MGTGRRSIIAPLVMILLTIPLVLLVKYFLFDKPEGSYVVKAEFETASGIVDNSNVKIGGVDAGNIDSIELTDDDTAIVTMRLVDASAPIGEGATATVRPVTLLGEKYVDLEVGDLEQELPSGETLPIDATGISTELDQVVNMLDADVRAALRVLINEAGIAMQGRGTDFNGLLETLPPAVDKIGDLVGEVEAENQNLGLLIEESDRVLESVANKREDLGRLVDSAGNALEVTASRREELAATFAEAPATLVQLRSALGELGTTADALQPAAVDLQRTAPPLTRALETLPEFADAAEETLTVAQQVAPDLTRLGVEGTPTIRRLRPTAQVIDNWAKTADPTLAYLSDDDVFAKILDVMNGWAKTIAREDGLSHTFGLRGYINQQALDLLIGKYAGQGEQPSTTSEDPEPQAAAEQPSSPDPLRKLTDRLPKLPDLPKTPDLPDVDVGDGPKQLIDRVRDRLDGIVDRLGGLGDLTQDQLRRLTEVPRSKVRDIADQLLGGGTKGSGGGSSRGGGGGATKLFDYLFSR